MTMKNNKKCWYVVYTHPNAEKKLFNHISNRLLESYLPLQTIKRQWSDRSKTLTVPLFKSYVFVCLDYNGLNIVKTLPGFAQYVRFGGYPAVIREQQIELLKVVVDNCNEVDAIATKLVKGDKVKICEGPMKGIEGILVSDQWGKKVAIEIAQLNQSVMITMASENLGSVDLWS